MRVVLSFSLAATLALSGCGSSTPSAQSPAGARCAASGARVVAPLGSERQSSAVALARQGKRTLAYVVDADDSTLRTIDVDARRELATTRLGGVPSHALVTSDGRVLVTLRDRSQIAVLEPDSDPSRPLKTSCTTSAPSEPIAMALTPDDRSLLVTSGWARSLARYDAASLTLKSRTSLAREPRAVVVSNDGKRAFVSHVVGGRVSVVPLDGGSTGVRHIGLGDTPNRRRSLLFGFLGSNMSGAKNTRIGCQGYALAKSVDPAGRILAPQVLVDPGDPSEQTSGYGNGFDAAEVASIAVIDEAEEAALETSLDASAVTARTLPSSAPRAPCLLPRAAATDAKSGNLLVACLGIDSVVEYDAASADPRRAERRRFPVAAGPVGLAIDAPGRRAVVFSQFERSVGIIDLKPAPIPKPGQLAHGAVSQLSLSRGPGIATRGDVALGRRLFHATSDTRISSDGRACASCHPDGREDSLTWATPGGPRQTPMLAGRLAHTAPYGWDGKGSDVETHLTHTFQRLGGTGLDRHEVDALLAFVASMPAPPPLDGADDVRVERGKRLFLAKETGCAGCHGAAGSDGKRHDVASKTASDSEAPFDTPSLRFIAGTAPYFHDGRYATLEELLRAADGKMGHTAHLSDDDLGALVAYLRTL